MELKDSANTVIRDLMRVAPQETVLVVVDERSEEIGQALWESAKENGAKPLLVKMVELESNGTEPLPQVAAMMKSVDVVLAPTSKSLSHTKARRDASGAGVRVASMPGITKEMMARTLSADYSLIKARTEKLSAVLNNAENVHVTTAAGTDLTLSLAGRGAESDTGLLDARGAFGNLPAGESYAAPLEGTSNGVVVIDGAMAGIGVLEQPLRITVRNGYAETIEGPQAKQLIELLDKHGKDGRNVAELGIGTNEKAVITGAILEDEKVMGTVHVAFGNNASMGGKVNVPVHLDGIINRPTVTVDGQVVMKDGEISI